MKTHALQAGVEQKLGTVVGHNEGVISHDSRPGTIGPHHMPISPLAGQPAESASLIDPARLIGDYYAIHPDSGRRRAARVLRNLGPPRQRIRRLVQRAAHSGDHAGDLRVSRTGAHRRPAVPRDRHAHLIRAGVCERSRSAGGERRRGADRDAAAGPAGLVDVDYTPTPAISHAIIHYNRGGQRRWPTAS